MQKVTVDEAIRKGHYVVNFPVFAIMILGFGLTLYLTAILKKPWIFPIGFCATFIFMWLWWSFMITKWRIWAFGNCRNVHDLKRRAINEKLIWRDGSIFEKTEIRTFTQKQQLKAIDQKFEKEDELEVIEDDFSVPEETKIYYSRLSLIIYWAIGIGLLVYGGFLVIEREMIGFFLLIISCFSIYQAYQKSSIKTPYIVLNSKGIKTLNTAFAPWGNVKKVHVKLRGSGKHSKWYLSIEFKNGDWEDDIEISDLSVSPKKIRQLINLYKQRNENQK